MSNPIPPPGIHPPIITRHHILDQLERISRDWDLAREFQDFLHHQPMHTSDELLEWLHAHNVMDEKLVASVRRKWGPAEGWLGDIHQHGMEKFRDAFALVGRGGPYLSAYLLIGFPGFRIVVHHAPEAGTVFMLAMCPRLPPFLLRNRVVNDPTFQSYLRGARDSVVALLADF